MLSFLCCPSYVILLMLSFLYCRSYVVVLMLSFLCCPYVVLLMLSSLCCPSYVVLLMLFFFRLFYFCMWLSVPYYVSLIPSLSRQHGAADNKGFLLLFVFGCLLLLSPMSVLCLIGFSLLYFSIALWIVPRLVLPCWVHTKRQDTSVTLTRWVDPLPASFQSQLTAVSSLYKKPLLAVFSQNFGTSQWRNG